MALSLCIVGCGGYARTVLDDIHDMTDDVRLFYASRDLEKARSYMEEYGGAGYFDSYEGAAKDPRVEALYFFTPHDLHLENALLAAEHSKHILMEKPIARTIPEARQMVDAAQDAGIKLMVAENYRFLPTVSHCKQLIESGAIGKLRLIQIQAEGYGAPTGWRASATVSGGGVFIDGGIHYVDALVNIGGYPERVYALKPPQVYGEVEGEDGIVVTLSLPGGAVGLINHSRGTAKTEPQVSVQVTGTSGQLSFEPFGDEVTVDGADERRTIKLHEGGRGVKSMIREFRSCIEQDREPLMSGEEGIKDLAVVLGAYWSAKEGTGITLSPP